jgi:hypothetical protein
LRGRSFYKRSWVCRFVEAQVAIPFGNAWHWLGGAGVAGAAVAEEILRALFHRARNRDKRKAREALEKVGGRGGVGLMDFQVAEQWGWEPKRARSALKRLQKSGEARQDDGRWYLTGAVQTRPSPRARPW